MDGAPGDAHDWIDGGTQGYQGHDCWMRPVAMLMFGMMLTDRARDGVLILAGAGPSDFPEALKKFCSLPLRHWKEV